MPALIVGLDPGTTIGICILDLDKGIVKMYSKKHMPIEEVRVFVQKFGEPVIVATDVSPAPSFVERVASAFGASLYTPLRNVSYTEKQARVGMFLKKHSMKLKNKHEKDALSAALAAYISIENKLRQIEGKVMKKYDKNKVSIDDVRKRVLSGEKMSFVIGE